MIPQEPVMLLSFINMKLRDYYENLQDLCEDLSIEERDLRGRLASINYHYDDQRNQFI